MFVLLLLLALYHGLPIGRTYVYVSMYVLYNQHLRTTVTTHRYSSHIYIGGSSHMKKLIRLSNLKTITKSSLEVFG